MTVVATLGEALGVLRADEPGPLALVESLRLSTGGAEANVAIGLARSGVAVRWLGRVGDDGLGQRVVRTLRAEGVDVRAVIDPDHSTGLLVKSFPGAGRTHVASFRAESAGSRLRPEDIDDLELETVTHLHVTGVAMAISESAAAAVSAAIKRARFAGVEVSLDFNYRASLWSPQAAAAAVFPLLAETAIVFAGADEARLLLDSGESDPVELARALQRLGPVEAVITSGANGAVAVRDEVHRIDAVRVRVRDTVGAGDAFVAAYLAVRLEGGGIPSALASAAVAGAAACAHPGDWEGFPFANDSIADDGDPVQR